MPLGAEGAAAKAIGNDSTTGTRKGTKDQERIQPSIPSKSKTKKTVPFIENGGGAAHAEEVKVKKSRRKKHAPGEVPPPLPYYLEKNVLEPIGLRFADQSPASSRTSMAWLYDEFRKRGLDEYSKALEKQINDAEDETKLRASRGEIHGRNRDDSIAMMPYFFSILEDYVNAWCQDFDKALAAYQQSMADQKESTNGLPFEHEDGQQITSTSEPEIVDEQDSAPASIELDGNTASSIEVESPAIDTPSPEVDESDLQLEQEQSTETSVVPEPPIIDDAKNGWPLTNAHHFGEHIRTLLGQDDYLYEVRPTRRTGHYGFVIKEKRGNKRIIGEFSNIAQVTKARKLAQTLNVEAGETGKRLATIPRHDLEDDPPTETQELTPTADTPEGLAAEIGAIYEPDHPHQCGCTVYYLSPSGEVMCAKCQPDQGVDDRWFRRLCAYYRRHLHLLQ
jgi:hypothetical protein